MVSGPKLPPRKGAPKLGAFASAPAAAKKVSLTNPSEADKARAGWSAKPTLGEAKPLSMLAHPSRSGTDPRVVRAAELKYAGTELSQTLAQLGHQASSLESAIRGVQTLEGTVAQRKSQNLAVSTALGALERKMSAHVDELVASGRMTETHRAAYTTVAQSMQTVSETSAFLTRHPLERRGRELLGRLEVNNPAAREARLSSALRTSLTVVTGRLSSPTLGADHRERSAPKAEGRAAEPPFIAPAKTEAIGQAHARLIAAPPEQRGSAFAELNGTLHEADRQLARALYALTPERASRFRDATFEVTQFLQRAYFDGAEFAGVKPGRTAPGALSLKYARHLK